MAIEVAMDLMQPRLLQRIIDRGVAHHDLTFVLHTGALMIGLALIGTAGGILCTVYAVRAAQAFGTHPQLLAQRGFYYRLNNPPSHPESLRGLVIEADPATLNTRS